MTHDLSRLESEVRELMNGPSYHLARCVAIQRNGKRCRGPWRSAYTCTFMWDPVTGVGIDGPRIVLCARHRRIWEERQPRTSRIRVWRGWLGPHNEYGYGAAVFARETGWVAARWWGDRAKPMRFGSTERKDAAP